jgi:hypothetical protein
MKKFLDDMEMPPFLAGKGKKKPGAAPAPAADAEGDEAEGGEEDDFDLDADSEDAEIDGALEPGGDPALAEISDDDLMAEAERRGMSVTPPADAAGAPKPGKKKKAEPLFPGDEDGEEGSEGDEEMDF